MLIVLFAFLYFRFTSAIPSGRGSNDALPDYMQNCGDGLDEELWTALLQSLETGGETTITPQNYNVNEFESSLGAHDWTNLESTSDTQGYTQISAKSHQIEVTPFQSQPLWNSVPASSGRSNNDSRPIFKTFTGKRWRLTHRGSSLLRELTSRGICPGTARIYIDQGIKNERIYDTKQFIIECVEKHRVNAYLSCRTGRPKNSTKGKESVKD